MVLIDPEREWRYDASKGFSKSLNSPWDGHTLEGRVLRTLVGGRSVYDADAGITFP